MDCHKIVISVGSNVSEGEFLVNKAIRLLSNELTEIKDSGCYITSPLSGVGENYVNAVVKGIYEGDIQSLIKKCKKMECDFGRDAESRRNHRVPLDLDVVIIDDTILRPKDYNYDYFQRGYIIVSTKN